MFKETIQYKDHGDKLQTKDLYFNLTKTDLLSNLALMDRVEEMAGILQGPQRELSTPEKQEMLNLVKEVMRLAYGVQEEVDGETIHKKSPKIWERFEASVAYDTYLMLLFTNKEKGEEFFDKVFPNDLVVQARAEAADQDKPLIAVAPDPIETEPTDEELLQMDTAQMTNEQLRRLVELKTQQ